MSSLLFCLGYGYFVILLGDGACEMAYTLQRLALELPQSVETKCICMPSTSSTFALNESAKTQRFIEINGNYTFNIIETDVPFDQLTPRAWKQLERQKVPRGKAKQLRGRETLGYSRAYTHIFTAQRS